MDNFRSKNPQVIHGTTTLKSVTVCGQRGRNVTNVWQDVTCQRCLEAMEARYGKQGLDFWKQNSKAPSVPEPKCGESLCCDAPDCPDKDGKTKEQAACEAHSDAVTCKLCEPPELHVWPCTDCGRDVVLGEMRNSSLDPSKGVCPECKDQEARNIDKWSAEMNATPAEYLRLQQIQQAYGKAKIEDDKRKSDAFNRITAIRMQMQALIEELGSLQETLTAPAPSFVEVRDRLTPPKAPEPRLDLTVGLGDLASFNLNALLRDEASRFKNKR